MPQARSHPACSQCSCDRWFHPSLLACLINCAPFSLLLFYLNSCTSLDFAASSFRTGEGCLSTHRCNPEALGVNVTWAALTHGQRNWGADPLASLSFSGQLWDMFSMVPHIPQQDWAPVAQGINQFLTHSFFLSFPVLLFILHHLHVPRSPSKETTCPKSLSQVLLSGEHN